MIQYCCVKCFAHEWLQNFVLENSERIGDCDYCRCQEVAAISIFELYHPFENLMKLYAPSNDPNGDLLIDLIQDDYEIFEDEFYADGNAAAKLLKDIMYSGWDDDSGEFPIDPMELYYHRSWYYTTMTDSWVEFCNNVKENPTLELSLPELFDDDLSRLQKEQAADDVIYRARPGCEIDGFGRFRPFEGSEIGAPPACKAKAGRANAEGHVVLYAAHQERIAVSEVRPWRGILVSVAELSFTRSLRIVDFSNPPPPSNPFTDYVYYLGTGGDIDAYTGLNPEGYYGYDGVAFLLFAVQRSDGVWLANAIDSITLDSCGGCESPNTVSAYLDAAPITVQAPGGDDVTDSAVCSVRISESGTQQVSATVSCTISVDGQTVTPPPCAFTVTRIPV